MALCTMNGQAGLQTQVHIYNGALTHTQTQQDTLPRQQFFFFLYHSGCTTTAFRTHDKHNILGEKVVCSHKQKQYSLSENRH